MTKRLRTWINHQKLQKELNVYKNSFEARKMHVPDEKVIRERFKTTFPDIMIKPKGTLSILAIYHHYNWENYSLKPSLEKLGTVRHYDWFDDYNDRKQDWHKSGKVIMNALLIKRVGEWITEDSTDAIFTYLSGEQVSPDTMKAIRSFGVPTVNLCLNDKEFFVGKVRNGQASGMRDICRHFDLCWTSTEDALKKYCVEGALPIYLPEGANPDIHRPYQREEQSIDVSFVGQCYGNRPLIIERLRKQGFQVEAFGKGWPSGPLSAEDMIRMYSRSRINLGFGGVDGHDDTYCLKGRDFEIPMSGGFYMTEYNHEIERVYDLGREIVTYSDLDDLIAKVRYFLSNPEEREQIRLRGFEKARREHSWETRFEKIFSLMGIV